MSSPVQSISFWGWVLRIAGVAVGAVLFLFVALALNQGIALRRFRERTPPPGRLIAVDGREMHIRCTGSGGPTVVIDAGNGCFSLEWTAIQDRLAESARVCTYDRAGYGWSEAGPSPRDAAAAVADLHALLHAAGEPGPYLLVGHSLGGIHARVFAATYPDEVAGMVLVDTPADASASTGLQQEMQSSIGFYSVMRLLAGSGVLRILGPLGGENAMPETARKMPAAVQDTYLNLLLNPLQYTTAIDEMSHLPQSLRQMDGAIPGDLPLIVLTAGRRMAPGSTPFDNRHVPVEQEVIDVQGRLAALSIRGEQRVIEQSGHQVHLDAPDAVVAAVQDTIRAIR